MAKTSKYGFVIPDYEDIPDIPALLLQYVTQLEKLIEKRDAEICELKEQLANISFDFGCWDDSHLSGGDVEDVTDITDGGEYEDTSSDNSVDGGDYAMTSGFILDGGTF